jgi:hypothetical protein
MPSSAVLHIASVPLGKMGKFVVPFPPAEGSTVLTHAGILHVQVEAA